MNTCMKATAYLYYDYRFTNMDSTAAFAAEN